MVVAPPFTAVVSKYKIIPVDADTTYDAIYQTLVDIDKVLDVKEVNGVDIADSQYNL
jgi:hypothetical protein